MSLNQHIQRFTLISISAITLAGCAKAPPAPSIKQEPLILKYEQTADSVHVRDASMFATSGSRGGAAIRQEEFKHVLWNTHYEADSNPTKLRAWQENNAQQMTASSKFESSDNPKNTNKKATTQQKELKRAAGKDSSFYAR